MTEAFGRWLIDHPRAARAIGLGLVAAGTWQYLQLLRTFAELDQHLRQHASDVARAASEALGG